MLDYYCYVYYDANWNAYYVGKGRKYRPRERHRVPIPSKTHVQVFCFDAEWKAYECEVELIAFYGRQCDGGTLMNVSTGGPGCPGVIPNKDTRKRLSEARKRLPNNQEIVNKMRLACIKPIDVVNVITNECRSFSSGEEAAKSLQVCRASVSMLRHGKRKTINNWRLANA